MRLKSLSDRGSIEYHTFAGILLICVESWVSHWLHGSIFGVRHVHLTCEVSVADTVVIATFET